MNPKLLNLIGMARRAGCLEIGFEAAAEAIRKNKASLVLIASDTAARTEKELRFHCKDKKIEVLRLVFTKFELSNAIGAQAGAVAICDKGFEKRAKELLSQGGNNL